MPRGLVYFAFAILFGLRPAAAAPPLASSATSDHTIDDPLQVPALDQQDSISLAFGGGVYLAAWHELRRADNTETVRAALLALDGTPMGSSFDLAPAGRPGPRQPAVAFDGTQFVAAWRDPQNAIANVRHVSTSGTPQNDLQPILEANDELAVAAGDGRTLVVYFVLGGGIHATLIDNNQAPATVTTGIELASSGENHLPSVAYGPGGFVVAWIQGVPGQDGSEVEAARVSTSGAVTSLGQLAPAGSPGNDIHGAPAVASSGSDFLVVWQDYTHGSVDIYGATVPGSGAAGTPFLVHTGGTHVNLQAAYLGGQYVVAWERAMQSAGTSAVLAVGVSGGAPVGSASTLVTGAPWLLPEDSQSRPVALASTGAAGRLAWTLSGIGITAWDVLTAPVVLGDAPGTSTPANAGPSSERGVASASNGEVSLVVWEDDRNVASTSTDLYGQRFDALGQKLGNPFPISAAGGEQRFPAVAALPGGDFLVAWVDRAATSNVNYYTLEGAQGLPISAKTGLVYAARVDADGTVLDTTPLNVGTGASVAAAHDLFPRIAANPSDQSWLLAWMTEVGGETNTAWSLVFRAVKANGTLGGASQLSTTTSGKPDALCGPHPAWTGASYLVVYERGCLNYGWEPASTGVTGASDILGQLVDKNGALVGSPVSIAENPTVYETMPTIASTRTSDGTGITVVAWTERTSNNLSKVPDPASTLHVAAVDGSGQVTATTPLVTQTTAPNASVFAAWPEIATAGKSFVLSFLDQTSGPATLRAVRLSPTGALAPSDLSGGEISSAAQLSPSEVPYASPLLQPEPLSAALAAGAEGQVLVAYEGGELDPAARVHTRLVHGKTQGDSCNPDPALQALGCGDGRCERDPEHDGSGLCCATECSGPCQKCTIDGCVGTPAGDSACGTISCAALDTTCRSYQPAPQACAGFGDCGSSADLSTCTAFTNQPDGTACALAGCAAPSCQAGECVCGDGPRNYGGPRALPPGCSLAGGAVGGAAGAGGGSLATLALGLALVAFGLARRRVRALGALVAIGLAGGCNDPTVLQIDLQLDDVTLAQTDRVRFVVSDSTQASFPVGAGKTPPATELVRNIDILGAGRIDIVADLLTQFPLLRETTYLKLEPSSQTKRNVAVSALAINRFGNPIAARRNVGGELPGASISLDPRCAPPCAGTELVQLTTPTVAVDDAGHAVQALAVGDAQPAGFVAAGVPEAGDASRPNAGRVVLYTTDGATLTPLATLTGSAGDQLGAALAFADLDGDGRADLLAIGAPGAAGSNGRVYLVAAPFTAEAALAGFIEGGARERFGAALAFARASGLAVGAPGLDPAQGAPDASGGAVYLFAQLAKAATPTLADAVRVPGPAGAHLGRAVDARGAVIAAGAPGANLVYVLDGSGGTSSWTSASAGAFGSQVAVLDVDADGQPEIAAAGAASGAGVLLIPAPASPGATLDDGALTHAVRLSTAGSLGAVLARVPTPFGDHLAAATLDGPTADGSAGGAFGLAGQSIATAGSQLPLGWDGSLAALTTTLPDARITSAAGGDVLSGGDSEYLFGDAKGRLYIVAGGAQ